MTDRFYFSAPEWVKELKDDDIYATVMMVLFELAAGKEPATEETVAKMLDDMEGTDEMRRTVLELIKEHKGDLGGITWMEEK